MKPKDSNPAFGCPGIEPRWTHGDKDGVGTAYAASSRIWFTLWNGRRTQTTAKEIRNRFQMGDNDEADTTAP